MNEALAKKLQDLPREPGVYFHKSSDGEIIYVGKAAVLRNRVRQYFQKSRIRDVKTDALVAEIVDTDWMVVESELEALFLEAEMIRRYMPRYNILLRDDKALSYIRVDYDSDYPTVETTRRPLEDGARYFGPYFSLYNVREALKLLRRIFPYATRQVVGQKRVSLHYHLGLDPGLENGKTSVEEYRKNLRRLMAVIEGKKSNIIREVEKDMKRAAKAQRFEEAAKTRNQLRALKELGRQVIFSDKEFLDISKDQALAQLVELLKQGNDDAGSMREIITRRLSEKNIKAWGRPSLMIIDGGKPQLGAALGAIHDSGQSIPCISVAKRDEELYVHKTLSAVDVSVAQRLVEHPVEGVFVREDGEYYALNLHVGKVNASSHSKNLRGGLTRSPYDDMVKLFQRIRDESHRFAVSYHTVLKRAGQTVSVLDGIPGVGAVTRKKLLRSFGSMRGVQSADLKSLEQAMGSKTAARIYQYLHDDSAILK